ncbi:FG-GAP-like repeat-containing protein [Candidatus Leptofilum sp.]|uniref:FG-GAP-like repeat-containing protein n=1 Tax=Candidatus Leptofilum sp. TaxID=3241576 RepID=UPI003B58D834
MSTKKLFIFLIFVFLVACQRVESNQENMDDWVETAVSTQSSTPLFQNISRAAGITQTRQGNDRAIGQAWGDYDRDGWVDFYVTDTEGPNSLFRNNGDGTFSRPPLAETIALPEAYSGGASFADYNNDGWPDLYVVNWGQNVLFRNEAGQGFTNVTFQAGVGGKEDNSQTASWGDYNNDGWLDLYVANWACYPQCGRPNQGDTDRLYHNNGDGTFTEVTRLLNGQTYGAGFVASFTDYDNDGDQDIYLVNDEFLFPIGNKLWRNDGPGCAAEGDEDPLAHCFTEIAEEAGADTRVMGMGLATSDYDNDGDFDFYFSNAGPMTLLQNQGDGRFHDVAQQAGVEMSQNIAWAATALDYDNDGWQDLYLAVMTTADHQGIAANPLFHNNGDGTFSRVSSGSGAGDVGPTMGIALADFDNDGWVDLLLGNKDEGYSLLHNQSGDQSGNNWLTLELVGAGPVNRDGVGSRVTIRTADGNVQMREVQNGSSLGAGHDLRLHFGLGAFELVDELTIRWPDGRTQTFTNIPTNRQISLPYPLDAAAEAAQQAALYPLTSNVPATNKLPTNLLIAANAIAWLGLFLLIFRYRHNLGISWQSLRWVGMLVILLVTAVYLFTNLQATSSPPETREPANRFTDRLAQAGAIPPLQLPAASEAEVALGRALFWDPILSGNKDIACVTCHHPNLGTGDELALSIGTGGQGLGPERVLLPTARQVLVPRNATPIYNLGLDGMDVMFWDGRVSAIPDGQFDSPANDDMPYNLANVVAVQAMFPVTSQDEMRGHPGEIDIFGQRNSLSRIRNHQITLMWEMLMAELLAVPAYQQMFQAAYPTVPLDELTFAHAANALAAYQMDTFTFLDSPWDRYLRGDESALSPAALAGAELFYGEAGCADCHSGSLLSDMQFHNIGVPQIGPGKGNEAPFDYGRARETGDESDLFAFRTPPLRNVAITGPWMHNGAYATLEAVIRHHLNPREAVTTYDFGQLSLLVLAEDSGDTAVHTVALNAPSFAIPQVTLTDSEITVLLAFLESLTSPSALDLSHTIPDSVPSGLQVGGSIN